MKPRFHRPIGTCFDQRILIAISPHLDDAVLGCGGLVAANPGALVVTVTAGRPGPHELTDWDRQCGFGPGDDVVGARRLEDEAALRHLGARPRWLEFLDRQYDGGRSPDPTQVAAALRDLVDGATTVASPLGLMHPDHVATATACRRLARAPRTARWIVYEDAIYRAHAGQSEAAIVAMRNDGFVLTPIAISETEAKRTAIGAYASQVRGLGAELDDAYRPERYWELG